MVLDLKFSRFEDAPWGFRLTGGADFEMPLTVIKVYIINKSHVYIESKLLCLKKKI